MYSKSMRGRLGEVVRLSRFRYCRLGFGWHQNYRSETDSNVGLEIVLKRQHEAHCERKPRVELYVVYEIYFIDCVHMDVVGNHNMQCFFLLVKVGEVF